MSGTLYYIHDPMCSWCWGFTPSLTTLLSQLPPDINIQRVLGGLAPDSEDPMPQAMQHMLQQTWQRIQSGIPGVRFNFDFWSLNQPRRSTWPSCRAVLAAKSQSSEYELPMISAIQHAYYLDARNPSDTEILISLAKDIGCDSENFSQDLHSEATQEQLQRDIAFSRELGIQGFPSLIFKTTQGQLSQVPVDYRNPTSMFDRIEQLNLA